MSMYYRNVSYYKGNYSYSTYLYKLWFNPILPGEGGAHCARADSTEL